MNKYHFDIKINDRSNNAGPKATDDCKKILLQNGYINIEINFIKSKLLLPVNFIKLFSILIFYFFAIPRRSLIFVQYPLKGINPFFKYFIRLLKTKACRFACIIHDLESLRSSYDQVKVVKEIDALSAYDAVISHNNYMSKWLNKNGFKKHIEEIVLFDYLVDDRIENRYNTPFDSNNISLAFAGNLNKTNFISNWSNTHLPFVINLYGTLHNKPHPKHKNLKWCGSFSPKQVAKELNGNFGLIWDGDSVDNISGLLGNYLKYNSPHKTSLYLVAGLPVIIWKDAAIADFIRKNDVGICIKDLASITGDTNKLSNASYSRMKENAQAIGEKLREGWYLNQAVSKVENYLYK